MRSKAVRIAALAVAALLVSVSCGTDTSGTAPATSPRPTGGPDLSHLELRTDGLGRFGFGRPMDEVFPALVELLGEPSEDARMHADMPFGYGDVDTTARLVRFDGLQVVFQDWTGYFRGDGLMHLVAWSAERRIADDGIVLATPAGIAVGAGVPELEAAFGSSLRLPDVTRPGCAGPPWYFAVDPEEPWGLIGSLSRPPSDPDAKVVHMSAGAQREGWIPCWS